MRTFYTNDLPRMSIYMQMLLRTNIGTFVGDDYGCIFYRCLITQINPNRNTFHGLWVGRPARRDLNNWTAEHQIRPYGAGFVAETLSSQDLEPFRAKIHGHEYTVRLPPSIQRGDEMLVHEYSLYPPPPGYVPNFILR